MTVAANVAEDAIRDCFDALEDALGRLPVDDPWRPALLRVRRALSLRLGLDPAFLGVTGTAQASALSATPSPMAAVPMLSELDARRRKHHREGEDR
jgi:hypothetical protein